MTDYPFFAPPPGGELEWETTKFESGGIQHMARRGGWIIVMEDKRAMKLGPNGIPSTMPKLIIRFSPSGYIGGSFMQNKPSEYQLHWNMPLNN